MIATATAFGVIFWLAIWALVIYAVSRSAIKRGRDPWHWGFLAFLIGLFAYIPLLIVGTTEEERLRRVERDEEARQRVRKENQ